MLRVNQTLFFCSFIIPRLSVTVAYIREDRQYDVPPVVSGHIISRDDLAPLTIRFI